MGTTLTPEFWERFAVLLFAAMGVTFALTALLDALALRWLRRHTHRPPTHQPPLSHRPAPVNDRPSVPC